MKKHLLLITLMIIPHLFFAQKQDITNTITQIEKEGIENSKVMDILSSLTNIYSPRLSGSKAYFKGAKWVEKELTALGCKVQLEPYNFPAKGWEANEFSVVLTSPRFENIISHPVAWSGSTKGKITDTPIVVDVFNLKALKRLKGKLKGRILLHKKIEDRLPDLETKLSKKELDSVIKGVPDSKSLEVNKNFISQMLKSNPFKDDKLEGILAYLKKEKVGAVLLPSVWDNHILEISSTSFQNIKNTFSVPFLFISKESAIKLKYLIQKNIQPKISVSSKTTFYNNKDYNVNILADIEGTDPKLKDEIILVGAHFDTWHGSGNASDNNAGVATIMEAFRILKKLGLKPKRTIRAGFWGGEEQIFYGSLSYLKKHIINASINDYKPEQSKTSLYLNIDSGGGAIRSFFTQGNKKVQEIILPWITPFKKWDLEYISSFPSDGSDHMVFDAANIPSIDAYQDPSLYWSHQHHTNIDEVALIKEEPMKRNAVIMAAFIYRAAMMDKKFPRRTN
ncbi:M28 family peptidase [Polaribacter cellanae]|uniref:Carboxypeptidase Q n=1 Tax=Polaribacter cellanae TaxID=2818493 RepID=A0A975H5D3_9FLAO|nr:M28 family peptidase [Polaribacter cellanae]QTE21301.1 M20/M25/M40 family metallo-hydrolase [Polaribacter cellanae]